MGKQAKSDIAAAAATDAGARKRASLTALALMFLLDEVRLGLPPRVNARAAEIRSIAQLDTVFAVCVE